MRILVAVIASIGLLPAAPLGALAQQQAVPKVAAQPAQPGTQPAKPVQQQLVMPDAEKIVLLLRSSLNTLNDALQTGNFTVLRDMGAPGFREANTAARLSQSFSDLAQRGVDLSVVNVIAPQLAEPPALDQTSGMLRLKGYFPNRPVQIDFELLYQAVDGRWRLFGLSVQARSLGPAAANLPAAAPNAAEP